MSKFKSLFHVDQVEQIGFKLGKCFADQGFLLHKENMITAVSGRLFSKGMDKITMATVNQLIAKHNLAALGPGIVDVIRQVAAQIAPFAGQKLAECLMGRMNIDSGLPPKINLDQFFALFPSGAQFEKPYEILGYAVGTATAESFTSAHPHKWVDSKLVSIGGWTGEQLGFCIAHYGWQLENKSNLLIDLIMKYLLSPSHVSHFTQTAIDALVRFYKLDSMGSDFLDLLRSATQSVGPYVAHRVLQCLLLPLSNWGRYKLVQPLSDSEKVSALSFTNPVIVAAADATRYVPRPIMTPTTNPKKTKSNNHHTTHSTTQSTEASLDSIISDEMSSPASLNADFDPELISVTELEQLEF